MAGKSLRDLRRKHNEERNEEMASLYGMMLALAQRDCFPTSQLRKYLDQDKKLLGYELDFANPWYVAEPVSTLQDINLVIDGHKIGSKHLTFVLRGQKIPVGAARTMHELWWGFGEVAQILVADPEFASLNLPARVALEIHLDMRTTMNYGIPSNLAQYALNTEMEVV